MLPTYGWAFLNSHDPRYARLLHITVHTRTELMHGKKLIIVEASETCWFRRDGVRVLPHSCCYTKQTRRRRLS
jgi:hypothetical protein